MNVPLQPSFFYKGSWTLQIDTQWVDALVRLKMETRWSLTEYPTYFVLAVKKELQQTAGICFSEIEIADRIKALEGRYHTFKEVVAYPRVQLDETNKCVTATDKVWEKIMRKNPKVGAYYYHHEPLFHKIAVLFGMDDVKLEGEKRTINISDSTTKMEINGPASYESDDDSEEVNSPAVCPTSKVRRKLFVDAHDSLDRGSTCAKPKYFLELGEDGEFYTKLGTPPAGEKGRGPTFEPPKPMPMASIASSCDSTSPLAWLRRP